MSNYLERYSREQIKKNLETVLRLEYLGVHIEDTKDLKDEFGLETIIAYYFTVPEHSTIEVENKELNEKVKSSDGLITLTKEILIEMCIDSFKDILEDDDFTKEMIDDFKSNPSEFVKFYAKVRKGETWDKEIGRKAVEKISNDIKRATGYKEV